MVEKNNRKLTGRFAPPNHRSSPLKTRDPIVLRHIKANAATGRNSPMMALDKVEPDLKFKTPVENHRGLSYG